MCAGPSLDHLICPKRPAPVHFPTRGSSPVLLSGGLGPGHPFGTDYGDPVGGGACRHGEAKPPDAPRPDSADVPIPAPGHAAALVQPLNPDPNVPGVHRSVVEHAPTHRLQARNRLIYLPSYPQGRSSHRLLSLACRWVQGQEAHESEVPHQSRRHVHHSRAGSDESRDGLVRCDPRSPPATGQATPQAPSPVLFPRSPVSAKAVPGSGPLSSRSSAASTFSLSRRLTSASGTTAALGRDSTIGACLCLANSEPDGRRGRARSSRSRPPWARMVARSITCWSSRTLPGQS